MCLPGAAHLGPLRERSDAHSRVSLPNAASASRSPIATDLEMRRRFTDIRIASRLKHPASVAASARPAGIRLARLIADDGPTPIELDPTAFFEHGLELVSASLDAAFHAGCGHASPGGCIRLTDAFQIGQRDRLPIRRRELTDLRGVCLGTVDHFRGHIYADDTSGRTDLSSGRSNREKDANPSRASAVTLSRTRRLRRPTSQPNLWQSRA